MSPIRTLLLLCLGLAIAETSACGLYASRNDAEAFAERYFAALNDADVTGALAFYSPRFFAGTPRDQWLATLQGVRERCGMPTSHSLENWVVTNHFGTDSGSSATLVYDVKYASCRLSETLVVFKPEGGEDKIVRHILKLEGAAPDKRQPAGTRT
jgi:hypothetical protein